MKVLLIAHSRQVSNEGQQRAQRLGGLIVPEGNACALAEAITKLRNSPALVAELGSRGFEQVHERYTWERIAEQMRDVYLDLVDQPVLHEEALA